MIYVVLIYETYGIETRADITKSILMMRTVEMRTLRMINGKKFEDNIGNENFLKQSSIQDIGQWTRKRKKVFKDNRLVNSRKVTKNVNRILDINI